MPAGLLALRNLWVLPLLLATLTLIGSCATGPREPTIWLEQVAREVPGATPHWQQAEPGEVGVRVRRGGVPIRAWRGMQLQRGDEVLTASSTAAVIGFRFGNTGAATGTVTLDEDTHVRVGSIEVFLGRIFANLRGLFEASSEAVVAGVEGTRFLFAVQPDRSVQLVVTEGVVNCRARGGEWSGVRVQAGQALIADYGRSTPPAVTRADPTATRNLQIRADEIGRAAASGWCCADGRVRTGFANACNGQFFAQQGDAVQACRPPPPEVSGWCCNDDRSVTASTQSQCRGSFDVDRARAARLCIIRDVRPVPPTVKVP